MNSQKYDWKEKKTFSHQGEHEQLAGGSHFKQKVLSAPSSSFRRFKYHIIRVSLIVLIGRKGKKSWHGRRRATAPRPLLVITVFVQNMIQVVIISSYRRIRLPRPVEALTSLSKAVYFLTSSVFQNFQCSKNIETRCIMEIVVSLFLRS